MLQHKTPVKSLQIEPCKVTKKTIRYRKSEAVKHLEMLADEAARKRYPNVPYLAPRVFSDKTPNELTKCVFDFLKLKGHFCEQTNKVGRVVDNLRQVTDVLGNSRLIGSIHRVYSSEIKSRCQLKAVICSKSISIEVKGGEFFENQSQSQRTSQIEVEKSGGIYITVPDFEYFLTWYKNFML